MKTSVAQSPLALICKTVPPHLCKNVAEPLRKLWPVKSKGLRPASSSHLRSTEVNVEYVTKEALEKEKAGDSGEDCTLIKSSERCL